LSGDHLVYLFEVYMKAVFLFSFIGLYCIITVVLNNGDRVYVI